MKEILEANGFVYVGICHKCGGGEKYEKTLGGQVARVKANEMSGRFTLTYMGAATPGRKAMLQMVLERNGLATQMA